MTGGNFGSSSFTMNNIETFDEVYHPWEELVSEMMRLVTVYDKLVSVDVIGTTAEGRPIHAIHINTHNEKVCWFTLFALSGCATFETLSPGFDFAHPEI